MAQEMVATSVMRSRSRLVHDNFIVANDLSLASPRLTAYEHVNLSLNAGAAHALVAEHKRGKTELLLTLAGRMYPTSGACTIDGINARSLRGLKKIRKFSALSFFDNVNEVQQVLRVRTVTSAELGLAGKSSRRDATLAYLKAWGLEDVADQDLESLDRITYDRLGIALGMASDPRILVVSDIETNLTEHQSHQLVALLKDVAHRTGTCVICGVTDYDLARSFDSATCITDSAKAQRDAVLRKLDKKKEEVA